MSMDWYPGHMAKALRELKQNCGRIHGILEILDARAPQATRNPQLAALFPDIPHGMILCKTDLADKEKTRRYCAEFQAQGIPALALSTKDKKHLQHFFSFCKKHGNPASSPSGMQHVQKFLIVGIPNVGKSSLINTIRGNQSARTGNKPGVTRHLKWIDAPQRMAFCDSPGILWPKIESRTQTFQLAACHCIKEERIPDDQLASFICEFLIKHYPHPFQLRYTLETLDKALPDLFMDIAKNRGFFLKNDILDEQRLYHHIIRDFQKGAFGRLSFTE